MMIDYAEKRDFLRLPIDCEFSFSKLGDSRQLQGTVINLSGKGILFTSRKEFDVGTILEVVLTPSNSSTPPRTLNVEVARVASHDAVFEIAGEFRDAPVD